MTRYPLRAAPRVILPVLCLLALSAGATTGALAVGTATIPAGGAAGTPAIGPVGTAAQPNGPTLAGATLAGATPAQVLGPAAGNATAERDGATLVVSIPADRIEPEGPVALSVATPAANGTVDATATVEGDRYVARVAVSDLVDPGVSADLSAATVRATHGGSVVGETTADLRYVAPRGSATFAGTTLVLPVDARGLGDGAVALSVTGVPGTLDATPTGVGPNATLGVSPGELRGVPVATTGQASVEVAGDPVPGEPLSVAVADAAARASALTYRGDRPVVSHPLLHPAIGPERVEVRIDTDGPVGTYLAGGANDTGVLPVPESVLGASSRRLTVSGDGSVLVDGVGLGAPGRPTVSLRIENRSLVAPDPDALAGYDAVVLRDDAVHHVAIGAELRAGDPRPLSGAVANVSPGATAILAGADRRPARVALTVVPPPPPSAASETEPVEADAFLALWADVGAGVALLVLAMVGATGSVCVAGAVRLASPARSAAAGGRAVLGHFVLGGVGGVVAIGTVQALWTGPVVEAVRVAGIAVGLGGLLVGSFHGGLTAVGLRIGLGTAGLWPTRTIVGRTVPVHVEVTDDAGDPVPGGPEVAVQRAGSTGVLATAGVDGTTAEVSLPEGDYRLIARTGERETDPAELSIPEPGSAGAGGPRPEPRGVALTVARPHLQVEVADADTDRPVAGAAVTVTTDRGETRTVDAPGGSADVALPIATGTVAVVADADRYERTTVEASIDDQLTTVDVGVPPATGTLDAHAVVDDQPLPGARVLVEPAEDDPPAVGDRTADVETGADGRASADLPVGTYRCRLDLDGPNAGYFAVADAAAAIEAGERSDATLEARFEWALPEPHRRRAGRIQATLRSVGTDASGDPTVPLYFAAAAEAMLRILAALPESGPLFADADHDPGDVAAATVDAAGATLQAVGRAMQADGVRPVFAAGEEPERVRPALDADPGSLLDHLGEDVAIATVESRATRVRERIDDEAGRLATVVPARAVAGVAVRLPRGADRSIQVATREYAAVLLLDAVEQCFDAPPIRRRFARASGGSGPGTDGDGGSDDSRDEEALGEAD